MRCLVCALTLVLVVPAARADKPPLGKAALKELKALEGKWKAVGGEAGGAPFPKETVPDLTLVVAAGGKATGRTSQDEFRFTMVVHPKQKPKSIENLHESGPDKGKTQYGIYKLQGDKFTVCMTPAGSEEGDRPKSFRTKESTDVVFVFERIKEDKKS